MSNEWPFPDIAALDRCVAQSLQLTGYPPRDDQLDQPSFSVLSGLDKSTFEPVVRMFTGRRLGLTRIRGKDQLGMVSFQNMPGHFRVEYDQDHDILWCLNGGSDEAFLSMGEPLGVVWNRPYLIREERGSGDPIYRVYFGVDGRR